jgi:hypothetical protein
MSTRHLFTVVVEQIDAPDPFDDAALLAAAQAFAAAIAHTVGHEATVLRLSVNKDELVDVPTMQHVTEYDLTV